MHASETRSPNAGPPPQVVAFIARFDRREYWLAHEELEELWLEERSDFWKGLIQVAAAFVHIDRANWNGANRLLRSARDYLDGFADDHEGFDVVRLRAHIDAIRPHVEELRRGMRRSFDESLRPRLSECFAGSVPPGAVEPRELPYRARRHEEGYRPGGAASVEDADPEDD